MDDWMNTDANRLAECEHPAVVLCDACEKYGSPALGGNLAKNNILICSQHKTDADRADMSRRFAELWPGSKGNVTTFNHLHQVLSVSLLVGQRAKTMAAGNCTGRSTSEDIITPVFNVTKGDVLGKVPENATLLCPSGSATTRLTQQLQLGSEALWTVYDPGATTHIIDRATADILGLQKLSHEPAQVRGMAGISPAEGTYELILGPDNFTSAYHKLHVVAVENFKVYNDPEDLSKLIWDLSRDRPPQSFDPSDLQLQVGTAPARLLLGCERMALHPRHQQTLPSGQVVFHSPLTDCQGKNFVLAGAEVVQEMKHTKAPDTVSQVEFELWQNMNRKIARVLGVGVMETEMGEFGMVWPRQDVEEEMLWDNTAQNFSFETPIEESGDLLDTSGLGSDVGNNCHFL